MVAPMGTSLDSLSAPSSLTQRRQAASNLPNFELPPVNNLHFAPISNQKYPPLSAPFQSNPAALSLGNLLTPPSNSASESGASSSANPTGTTPNNGAAPVLPYTPTFFQPGSTPGFHTGLTPQPWGHSLFPPRSMFSPSANALMRNSSNSPSAGDGTALPPPPYDLSQYGAPFGMNSPTGASLSSHQIMSNSMMRPPSQQASNNAVDNMVSKPPSAPPLFTNMPPVSGPPSGYPYSSSTSVSQSPHSANGLPPRESPQMRQSQMPPQQSQSPFIRPPYPSYSLPAMPGPTMSNVNSPGSQMSMIGNVGGMPPVGFNSGFVANPQHMYGQQRTQSPQQAAQNDRPFRCDSCPQSFHRNHDLKRHKRIHLAVKPFPCKYCDKSFSRKDALKVSHSSLKCIA